MSRHASHRVLLRSLFLIGASAAFLTPAAQAGGPYQYHSLTPCRIADTRFNSGTTNGGPALHTNSARNFQIQGTCGVPVGAQAATLNLTIVTPAMTSPNGFLTVWPSGSAQPTVSTINFTNSDTALANGAIVPLSANAQDMSVYFGGAGTVHLIIDVTGYFQ